MRFHQIRASSNVNTQEWISYHNSTFTSAIKTCPCRLYDSFLFVDSRKLITWYKRMVLLCSSFMGGYSNNSTGHSQYDEASVRRMRVREIGRTLARIGDDLNQEIRAHRTVQSSTAVLVFQLANLGGVSMSFLIPIRISFPYQAGISVLVYIIRFFSGGSFITVPER